MSTSAPSESEPERELRPFDLRPACGVAIDFRRETTPTVPSQSSHCLPFQPGGSLRSNGKSEFSQEDVIIGERDARSKTDGALRVFGDTQPCQSIRELIDFVVSLAPVFIAVLRSRLGV